MLVSLPWWTYFLAAIAILAVIGYYIDHLSWLAGPIGRAYHVFRGPKLAYPKRFDREESNAEIALRTPMDAGGTVDYNGVNIIVASVKWGPQESNGRSPQLSECLPGFTYRKLRNLETKAKARDKELCDGVKAGFVPFEKKVDGAVANMATLKPCAVKGIVQSAEYDLGTIRYQIWEEHSWKVKGKTWTGNPPVVLKSDHDKKGPWRVWWGSCDVAFGNKADMDELVTKLKALAAPVEVPLQEVKDILKAEGDAVQNPFVMEFNELREKLLRKNFPLKLNLGGPFA